MIAVLSLYVDMKREINMIKEKFTKIIEKELKEYLYEFPYNLNNLTADTIEF